ncbi:hypothetical protein NEMIN01_0726 [Nematocida minor]|uniref:uncharacterized protein n=1 Tax=Nematocida minor TaxID=1912983 RepID=UPI00221F2BB8|nr:uncharacterized protein NEMIN01_0726 [Nematocida minor]KAI5189863.1 hypothetical protein NEMIN01_0726 [Nematocida minor]
MENPHENPAEDDFLKRIESSNYISAYMVDDVQTESYAEAEVLMTVCAGAQTITFKVKKEGDISKIELHLHSRNEPANCTSVCKEVAHCTLTNKFEMRKRNQKYANFSCAQCGTTTTPLWRKRDSAIVCNACGLYSRTHGGMGRPKKLFKFKSGKDKTDPPMADSN